MQYGDQQMLQKLNGRNPASVAQCYTRLLYNQRRATRRESALLRTPVWQQCWFDSCKDDMCGITLLSVPSKVFAKHLAQHGKQSYPSIIAALWLGWFSFIQRDYDALVPFFRNHFLFPDPSDYFVQCAYGITATMLDVLWMNTAYSWCLDLVHGFIDINDRRREGINGGIIPVQCHSENVYLEITGRQYFKW